MKNTQKEISLAGLAGRLDGSADSLGAVLSGYGDDLGMAKPAVERAIQNLRDAAAALQSLYRGEAKAIELERT